MREAILRMGVMIIANSDMNHMTETSSLQHTVAHEMKDHRDLRPDFHEQEPDETNQATSS